MAAVLVSGGNRGIGLSICKGLAQKGCRVFMGSRDLAKGEEAKESLGSELAALITVVALDVTSDESIAAAVAAVSVALGSGTSLAGLINNAGGTFGGGLGFSSADNWEATMNLNYLGGCVKMTEAFVPLLDKATGRLVNVSSGAAPTFVSKCSPEYIAKFCDWDTTSPESLMSIYEDAQKIAKEGGGDVDAVTAAFGAGGLGDGAPYHFSKALMNGYTQVTQKAHPHLIVNSCSPGFIETDLTRPMAARMGKTPAEMGMKTPDDGARCPLFLMLGEPQGRGWYYGSDCERSPMDTYRSPGDPPYTGGDSQASSKGFMGATK